MKKLAITILSLVFGLAAIAQAQPDPRDSVIIESKTVEPIYNAGGSVRLKVYITNQDSLTFLNLVLTQRSNANARMDFSYPRTFAGVVEPLTNTLQYNPAVDLSGFPDRFKIAAGYNPSDPSTIEPPNPARKAIWELKFDAVYSLSSYTMDIVVFDTTTLVSKTGFTNTIPMELAVNFLSGRIEVDGSKYDTNADGFITAADFVLVLNCVFLNIAPPRGVAVCDLTCDGEVAPADAVVSAFMVWWSRPFGC